MSNKESTQSSVDEPVTSVNPSAIVALVDNNVSMAKRYLAKETDVVFDKTRSPDEVASAVVKQLTFVSWLLAKKGENNPNSKEVCVKTYNILEGFVQNDKLWKEMKAYEWPGVIADNVGKCAILSGLAVFTAYLIKLTQDEVVEDMIECRDKYCC